ncbi:hypothetical protein M8494_29140 [Serratia ureilytica]
MVVSDTIYVMLLTHDKFRVFTPNPIGDAKQATEVLVVPVAAQPGGGGRTGAQGGRRRRQHLPPAAGLRRDVRPRFSGSGRPYLGIDVYGSRGGAGANNPTVTEFAGALVAPVLSCRRHFRHFLHKLPIFS